jgi:hypothetical protein
MQLAHTILLAGALTEVGTLEMHCVSVDDAAERSLLEFDLRRHDGADADDGSAVEARQAAAGGDQGSEAIARAATATAGRAHRLEHAAAAPVVRHTVVARPHAAPLLRVRAAVAEPGRELPSAQLRLHARGVAT